MSYVVEYPGEARWSGTNVLTVTLRPTLAQRMFGIADQGWVIPSHRVGERPVPNKRSPVNPYRHAYTRAKHFRRALDRIQLFAGSYGHRASAAVIFFPALVRVQAAAENADWGCP